MLRWVYAHTTAVGGFQGKTVYIIINIYTGSEAPISNYYYIIFFFFCQPSISTTYVNRPNNNKLYDEIRHTQKTRFLISCSTGAPTTLHVPSSSRERKIFAIDFPIENVNVGSTRNKSRHGNRYAAYTTGRFPRRR